MGQRFPPLLSQAQAGCLSGLKLTTRLYRRASRRIIPLEKVNLYIGLSTSVVVTDFDETDEAKKCSPTGRFMLLLRVRIGSYKKSVVSSLIFQHINYFDVI